MKHAINVYFDGDCGFCTTVSNVFQKLDFLRLLHFISFRKEKDEDLPASRMELEKAVIAVTGSGKKYSGMSAAAVMMSRLPELLLPTVFLVFLNRIGLGSQMYEKISENRYRYRPGTSGKQCQSPLDIK